MSERVKRRARAIRNAARRRGGGGSDTAESWLTSAANNFARVRARPRKGQRAANPCSLIEHYTDVVAEATVAAVKAAPGSQTERTAEKLLSTATRAQRGAVAACARRGER